MNTCSGIVLALHEHASGIWNEQCTGLIRYCRSRRWRLVDFLFTRKRDFNVLRHRIDDMDSLVGIISSLSLPIPDDISARTPVVYFDCPESAVPVGSPYVRHDSASTAHLAVNELMSLGLPHFVYVHRNSQLYWCRERGCAFMREIRRRNGSLLPFFDLQGVLDRRLAVSLLAKWIATVSKPCGVFAANDEIARLLVLACRRTSLRIPEDVAIVGVDNDSHFSGIIPEITSIVPDWDAGAFMAAEALDVLVRGVKTATNQTFRPLGLIRRQTTSDGHLAQRDACVLDAVRLIREKACGGLRAEEVLLSMRGSRRYAEQAFRRVTGQSVLEAIRNERFSQAKVILQGTDVPIGLVAGLCGYSSVTTFCRTFKRETGLSPFEWRKKSSP